jgi:hypothetical protein
VASMKSAASSWSSGSKSKLSKKSGKRQTDGSTFHLLIVGFFLGLHLDPQDGGFIIFWTFGTSLNYTVLQPSRPTLSRYTCVALIYFAD